MLRVVLYLEPSQRDAPSENVPEERCSLGEGAPTVKVLLKVPLCLNFEVFIMWSALISLRI